MKLFIYSAIIALSFFSNTLKCQASKEKVLYIAELTRHGARTPIASVKEVDWMKKYNPEELTRGGMRQHYVAGKDLMLEYPEIFNRRLNSTEIWVRSTGYNRTIQSANSHLYGIFEDFPSPDLALQKTDQRNLPPFNNVKTPFDLNKITWDTALPVNYNPYPVHTPTDKDTDTFLGSQGSYCNASYPLQKAYYAEVNKQVNETSMFQEPLKRVIELYDLNVSTKTGYDLNTAFHVSDFLNSDYANSATPLLDIKDAEQAQLKKDMERLYTLSLFAYVGPPTWVKQYVTKFMQYIRDTIVDVSTKVKNGTYKEGIDMKYSLLSGHDSTSSAVMLANGLWTQDCLINAFKKNDTDESCPKYPPLATSFRWVLVQKTDGSHAVRVTLNGDYINFCHLEDPSAKSDCDLDKFSQTVDNMVLKDFDSTCFAPPDDHVISYFILGWICVALGILLLCTVIALIVLC